MSLVQERAAAVLDFCRHARTMSKIRQHFYEWPDKARYTVQNLVKSNHLVNLLPGARRGLYLTVSKPPVQRVKPKTVKPTPMRRPVANSVWQLGSL
jgi:hypothetical protein